MCVICLLCGIEVFPSFSLSAIMRPLNASIIIILLSYLLIIELKENNSIVKLSCLGGKMYI